MKLFYLFFTLWVQSTVISNLCEVNFSVLFHSHFESPPICSPFLEALHPLPPAGTLILCGTASNPPPRRLCHFMRLVTVASRVFLSRRCAPHLVYLGIPTPLCTCGHSKKSIMASWIKKWNIKYCYLCMQTLIFFSDIVLSYSISPLCLTMVLFLIQVIFGTCDIPF